MRSDKSNMNVVKKIKNALRGAKQRWGSEKMKQRLWNEEFASGRWESLENTSSDVIYHYVEKYCRRGSILDLGCGSGNTGCELDSRRYQTYTGVDISDVALEKARRRSEACLRGEKNDYIQSDISAFVPAAKYDVILFRESIYYIPRRQIESTLVRYSEYLRDDGVLIVKWHDAKGSEDLVNLVETKFQIVERHAPELSGPVVLVFRQRSVHESEIGAVEHCASFQSARSFRRTPPGQIFGAP